MATAPKVEYNPALHADSLKHSIKECSDHLAIIEGARTAMKEIKKHCKEELGVEPKLFQAMLNLYHQDARDKFEDEKEDILEIYDAIFKG